MQHSESLWHSAGKGGHVWNRGMRSVLRPWNDQSSHGWRFSLQKNNLEKKAGAGLRKTKNPVAVCSVLEEVSKWQDQSNFWKEWFDRDIHYGFWTKKWKLIPLAEV